MTDTSYIESRRPQLRYALTDVPTLSITSETFANSSGGTTMTRHARLSHALAPKLGAAETAPVASLKDATLIHIVRGLKVKKKRRVQSTSAMGW